MRLTLSVIFFYSTIFVLGLVNPGHETKTGGSLLVMAIIE
jgi:fucose permease